MTQKDVEIGVLIYSGAQQAAVLGMTDLFQVAAGIAESKLPIAPRLSVTHWRFGAGSEPERCFGDAPDTKTNPQVLICPPSLDPPKPEPLPAEIMCWLRGQYDAGVTLASVCAGAFLLAESGLLEGRAATTHWMYAETFRQRYPGIKLDSDRLIIDEGDIITAGGAMSWTDLGLKLVDRFLGPNVMIETARMLLIDPSGREQRYYSAFSPNLTHGDSAILKVQHWLHGTNARETSLAALSEKAELEERTFLRRFQAATGMTTTEYTQQLRVSKARELLQFERTSIDRIAWEVGYSDPGSFRKVFFKVVGLTPGEYRKRFSAFTH